MRRPPSHRASRAPTCRSESRGTRPLASRHEAAAARECDRVRLRRAARRHRARLDGRRDRRLRRERVRLRARAEAAGHRQVAGARDRRHGGLLRPPRHRRRARRISCSSWSRSSCVSGFAPLPGVVDLLDAIGDRVPIAVASNSSRQFLADLARRVRARRSIRRDGQLRGGRASEAASRPLPRGVLAPRRRPAHRASRSRTRRPGSRRPARAARSCSPCRRFPAETVDGDFIVASLADPAVLEWGRSVQPI